MSHRHSGNLGIHWALFTALVAFGIVGAVAAATLDEKPIIRTTTRDTTRTTLSLDIAPARTHIATPRNDTCQRCHSFDPLFSHPVGIVPPQRMDIPANLPLIDGYVTCMTCHPDLETNHFMDRTGGGPRGVTSSGPAFCSQCHDTTGITMADMHARAAGQAHPSRSGGTSSAAAWMDSPSTSCLSCHDGSVAGDISMVSSQGGRVLRGPMSNAHPVAIAYRISESSAADGGLKPVQTLDARIRLFNNRVECGSCHSLFSSEPNLLVMSNDRSGLCLSCHEY